MRTDVNTGVTTGDSTVRVDSEITLQKALEGCSAPDSVLGSLCLVGVEYYGFDGALHRGQIVVRKDLAQEISEIFGEILALKFPVESVIPIKFDKPDNRTSMDTLNNTYGFHYRAVKTTQTTKLSNHSFGTAIDINPFQNPAILRDGRVLPAGGKYDPAADGTLTAESPVVKIFLRRGWEWGGGWVSLKDYMHFEKK